MVHESKVALKLLAECYCYWSLWSCNFWSLPMKNGHLKGTVWNSEIAHVDRCFEATRVMHQIGTSKSSSLGSKIYFVDVQYSIAWSTATSFSSDFCCIVRQIMCTKCAFAKSCIFYSREDKPTWRYLWTWWCLNCKSFLDKSENFGPKNDKDILKVNSEMRAMKIALL